MYQGRKFVLTIHGAKPKNCPILQLLKQQFQKDEYTVVAVAYETGENGVHPHWQIYFQLAERVSNMKTRMQAILQGSPIGKGFHIEKAKGTQSANLAYVYAVTKQHELGWIHYAKGHDEPFNYEKKKRGCENLLWLHDNMKPWQKEVLERATSTAGYRDILWIHEPVGSTGKSYLAKYLHYFHGAIITGGSPADMKYAIARWQQITGSYPVIIIFDLARQARMTQDSYYVMQQIKNGLFFSGKYESHMVATLQPPHVVVFANTNPDTDMMSKDRWDICTIDPNTHELVRELGFNKPQ